MIDPAPPSSLAGAALWRVIVIEPGQPQRGGVYVTEEQARSGARDFAAAACDATVFLELVGSVGTRKRLSGPSRCAGCAGHVDVDQRCDLCTEHPRTLDTRTAGDAR